MSSQNSDQKSEFLGIGNQYLSFADALFNKYKTLYNEQRAMDRAGRIYIYIRYSIQVHKEVICSYYMLIIVMVMRRSRNRRAVADIILRKSTLSLFSYGAISCAFKVGLKSGFLTLSFLLVEKFFPWLKKFIMRDEIFFHPVQWQSKNFCSCPSLKSF